MTTALLYLGLDTVAIFIISIYLSVVLPGDFGVRKSPFFPLIGEGGREEGGRGEGRRGGREGGGMEGGREEGREEGGGRDGGRE